jgi:tetraacyldisaccharide 4'-kinase
VQGPDLPTVRDSPQDGLGGDSQKTDRPSAGAGRHVAAFRDLVSGRRRGAQAALARMALRMAEFPYTWAVNWRNRRFDRQAQLAYRAAVPVISVGNLTTGGTGKTPLVQWLARWFRQRDIRVTIISRGYGAEAGARNDEALELEQRLPDVPHLQNPDRVEAARIAIQELDCQLILLDDAFQHRRIARDLDIVLLDALEPFGYGHVLPRGLLREPVRGLSRADMVALSRADCVDRQRSEQIHRQVSRYAPHADWLQLAHRPTQLRAADQATESLEALAGRPVGAFCGLGNPEAFQQTLRQCGFQVVGFREYPDHHPYSRRDVQDLGAWIESLGAIEAVICAHKDLVKIGVAQLGNRPLWAIEINLDIRAGQAGLERRLNQLAQLARGESIG